MAEVPSVEDSLVRLVAVAEDQLRWQRAAVLPQVRQTIAQTLNTKRLRKAYEMLDGAHLGKDVAKATDVSEATLSRWARRWRNLGIAYEYVDEDGVKRTKHLISLEDLELPIDVGEG
ncbi:MAG: hypothetical protein M3198_10635 [Actinomycetota bacterium]|nr:hypothetical protein [Actinomycetota bacterium]